MQEKFSELFRRSHICNTVYRNIFVFEGQRHTACDIAIPYAAINLTGYHPPLPRLTAGPLIFSVKIPTPGAAFQCKTPAPGSKNETKVPTPGHNLPSSNAKISIEKGHYSIKAVSFQIFHNCPLDNFLLS